MPRNIDGVSVRLHKGKPTPASLLRLWEAGKLGAASATVELPTPADLLDPIRRDEWIAKLTVACCEGRLATQTLNQVVRVARELRENSRISDLRSQVLALADKLEVVLAMRAGIDKAEVEAILRDLAKVGVAK
jgi:hypothetical protein